MNKFHVLGYGLTPCWANLSRLGRIILFSKNICNDTFIRLSSPTNCLFHSTVTDNNLLLPTSQPGRQTYSLFICFFVRLCICLPVACAQITCIGWLVKVSVWVAAGEVQISLNLIFNTSFAGIFCFLSAFCCRWLLGCVKPVALLLLLPVFKVKWWSVVFL